MHNHAMRVRKSCVREKKKGKGGGEEREIKNKTALITSSLIFFVEDAYGW